MLDLGPVRLDLDGHTVVRPDGTESLTQLEVDALRYLLARAGQVVGRTSLEREVWQLAPNVRSEAVPVAMRRLRRKLGEDVLITVRAAGWRIDAPRPERAPARVPTFATPFVGRAALLETLQARLAQWRLVTLRGPGGVGKTRLAMEVAGTWPGEVVAVSLLGARPGEDALTTALADALGLAHGGAPAVRRGLAARDRALLVLDEAEGVADGIGPVLGRLVRDVPTLRVLVTSRVGLGVPEEHALEIPPFPPAVARAFLLERLRGVHPDPEREGAAIDALVEALDGLPGSLELYAGRAWLGLAPLVEELRVGRQDATLDAQVRRSWDALDPVGREVLLACSLFSGTFPTEAAVAASKGRPAVLAELRRRSLAQLDPDGKLFLLATVRRFCEQQPDAEGARGPARDWVLARAEAAGDALLRRPAEALRELRTLRPHLLEIVRTGPRSDAARAALAASSALALTGPTTLRVDLLAAIDWRPLPAPVATRIRVDLARARRATGVPIPELAPLVDGLDGPEAALLRGDHAVAMGDTPRALAAYADAIAQAPEGAWIGPIARVRRSAPASLSAVRPAAEVDEDLALATEACERHGLALHLPEVLRAVGAVRTARGDDAGARASLGRALQLAEAAGLRRVAADLWNSLGVAWFRADIVQADACFARAARSADEQGDDALLALFQLNLASARLLRDRPDDALALLDGASAVLRNQVARQLCDLFRGGALAALGRELDAVVVLESIDPAVVGALYSPAAAAHGTLLLRFLRAEASLRRLAEAPAVHGPPLRALLEDAAIERRRTSAVMLGALADRLERRLQAVGSRDTAAARGEAG